MISLTDYPESPSARTRWIEALRSDAPPKNLLNPWQPYAFLNELEVGPDGCQVPTTTVFLTNRECPYRCLMCDLWTNTLDARVPLGAIPAQIRYALDSRSNTKHPTLDTRDPMSQIKLYNAGSFFDPAAIPPEDYSEIASVVSGFSRVIVECHPALVGQRTLEFARLLNGSLEVAVGLETVHSATLHRLNKRFTVGDFRRAADFLRRHGIALRVFLLLRPPFMSESDGLEWAMRSLDAAFDAGAEVCCVIPTRGGNGAMELLSERGQFRPPRLASLESAVEYGIGLGRGRVFADLWDGHRLCTCTCSEDRLRRLEIMNRTQAVPEPVLCERCGEAE